MDIEDRKLPELDPRELGKVEDKKRKFMNEFRPHQRAWNFKEEADPTPHVIRLGANPAAAYIDGRIEQVMADITALGIHLRNYKQDAFQKLTVETQLIFKTHEDQ